MSGQPPSTGRPARVSPLSACALPCADVLVNPQDAVGESPVWCAATQRLWWTDIDGQRIHALTWPWQRLQTWALPERTGCLGLHADGGLIAGMTGGIRRLQPHDDGRISITPLFDAPHPHPDMRFNDGRTDREGRFWSTTMVRGMAPPPAVGQLYVTERGQTRALMGGFLTPNGMAFSPDGRTMYLADSHASVQQVWRAALDDEGQPGPLRPFIDMTRHPGRPDGAAVDADGCYWICGNDAGLVHRFTPQGRWDRAIRVPVDKPAMCAFAGPDLDTLVITTIRPAQPPAPQAGLAGAVFAIAPGVRGLAETPYRPR